ncbi:hypothetical protein BDV41DRAFT_585435 [Aspergillus transmontanensis]|uniref:Major facilitator superfamily (MFS) profile domain-containing protein n=1 Tax=Aspergillus transmontanensis TaxID=1034304 RepID=A0A5N6W6I9_9EURO|nr:hypothetical protein BDV41DRAFT_585435 [Aspergillus transmontanensis]
MARRLPWHTSCDEIEQTNTGAYVWLLTLTATIGGMLFRYETGMISAVVMITSLCSAGSFLGAIIADLTADKYGRKGPTYVGCALFTIGAIRQASAYSVPQMAVGRLIVGHGVGSAEMIVPAYIAEIAPMKYRGRMVGLNNVSITGGQVISYDIGAAFASVPHGWHYMVGLGGVPSILLAVLLPLCPESPCQLISHGKVEEAANVLHRISSNASEEQVSAKIQLISETVQEAQLSSQGRSRWDIVKELHKNPAHFRALVCACGLIGFSNAVAVSLVVSGTNMVSACINMLLLSTAWGMAAGLLAVAISFIYIPANLDTLEVQDNTITAPAIVGLVFIIWFIASYGSCHWDCTCYCWGSNLIVSSTFLSMMKGITPSGAFGFYAGLCFVGWILIIFFYPEMSGLTLEESQEVFQHGFGVKYARQLRKERRRGGE